jgi:hypothetical protein
MDQCLCHLKATSQALKRLKSMRKRMLKPMDMLMRESDGSCGIRRKASVENTLLDVIVYLSIETAQKDVLESVKSQLLKWDAGSLFIACRMKMAQSFGYIIIALHRILRSIINITGFVDQLLSMQRSI